MIYTRFFGLREEPFGVTPDPRFLYLSRQHEEALECLRFGIKGHRGFLMLTGEVGSGKTTIVRYLLQHLDAQGVHTALILNPKVEALELLKMINHDFGLPAGGQSYKELLEELNAFLLGCHREGRQAVLVVDEAQELSPECLEFIRLLGNLETDTTKLLQVLLVGQPELQEIIQAPRLRQLAQRVVVRYHLQGLSQEETAQYIRHRLKVAGSEAMPFGTGALKLIHQFSRGIPRLINLASDRALTAAYARGRHKVTARLAREAIGELRGQGKSTSRGLRWAALAVLALALLGGAVLVGPRGLEPTKLLEGVKFAPLKNPSEEPPPLYRRAGFYYARQARLDETACLLNLLQLWGQQGIEPQALALELQDRGFMLYRSPDLEDALRFGLPMMLRLRGTEGRSRHVLLRWLFSHEAYVIDPLKEAGQFIPLRELRDQVIEAVLPYRNPFKGPEGVKALEEALLSLGYLKGRADDFFGPETYRALQAFQAEWGLQVTGLLDRPTTVALAALQGPSLRPAP
jgi:general secretion pathway protein A